MARHPGEAPIDRDEVEDRDTYLGIRKRKRGGVAKKKKFPFYSKATGGLARRRPDRRAAGGEVERADLPEFGHPEGIVKQKFQYGGLVPLQEQKARRESRTEYPGQERVGEDIARRSEPWGRPYTEEKFLKGRDEAMPVNRKRGGHITTAQRKALPSSDFALPGKGKGAGGKGPGSYPIDTPNRARNALARGAQHASPAELATIKRKVHAKYPGIGES